MIATVDMRGRLFYPLLSGGFAPRTAYTLACGNPEMPRAARVAHSRCSFAYRGLRPARLPPFRSPGAYTANQYLSRARGWRVTGARRSGARVPVSPMKRASTGGLSRDRTRVGARLV